MMRLSKVRGQEQRQDPDAELLRELEEGLAIDKNDLDEEVIKSPDLVYRVHRQYEALLSRRDAAEQAYKETCAVVDAELREAANIGDSRTTEGEIKAMVTTSKRVVEAHRQYRNLKHAVGKFSALKDAYKQRGYALSQLVDLYISNYYGQTVGSGHRSAVADRRAGQARDAMREARRKHE